MISRIFFPKENLLKIISLNERVEGEAATRPEILHFFFSLVSKILFLSGKRQGSLKRDVGGNHVLTSTIFICICG